MNEFFPQELSEVTKFSGLLSQLDPNWLEESQVAQEGYSLRSALKEITQVLVDLIQEKVSHPAEQSWWLENWSDLVAQYLAKELPQAEAEFVGEIFGILYDYLQNNISKHLGETLEIDEGKVEAGSRVTQFAKVHGLRKRVFEYSMSADWLERLIKSTKRRVDLGGGDREVVEATNTRILSKINATAEFTPEQGRNLVERNLMMVEVSPPIYDFQHDIMVRFHKLTRNGWETRQLSLPRLPETNQMHYQFVGLLKDAELNFKVLPKRSKSLVDDNAVLANSIVLVDNDIDPAFVEEIFLKNYGVLTAQNIDANLLAANDSHVDSHLDEIMQELPPFINEVIAKSVSIHKNGASFNQLVQRYDAVLHAAKVTKTAPAKLAAQNHTEADISKLRDVKSIMRQAASGTLDDYISENISTGRVQVKSEGYCSTSEREYGAGSEQFALKSQPPLPAPITVGNTQIPWVARGDRQVLAFCPRCGHPDLDPCEKECAGCHRLVSDIHHDYKQGTLPGMQTQNPQPPKTSLKRESTYWAGVTNAFVDAFRAITLSH